MDAARRCLLSRPRGVREGDAAGVVSAGNTGALMAMAKLALRTLPGIDRPAIAAIFPTMRGESVMLDLGANVECDAEKATAFDTIAYATTVDTHIVVIAALPLPPIVTCGPMTVNGPIWTSSATFASG
mgnify:CR=1 FL=1